MFMHISAVITHEKLDVAYFRSTNNFFDKCMIYAYGSEYTGLLVGEE